MTPDEINLYEVTVLLQSPVEDHRLRALRMLDRHAHPPLLPDLLTMLADDPSERVRAAVANVFDSWGDLDTIPALIVALKDESAYVRREVCRALRLAMDERAVPALIATLQDDDSEARAAAADALGETGGLEAASALIDALSDSVPQVAVVASQSLLWIGKEAVPLLEKRLATSTDSLRIRIEDILTRMDSPNPHGELPGWFRDKSGA